MPENENKPRKKRGFLWVIIIILMVVLAAILLGMIYSLLLAVAAIRFRADQTITGTAMNMLATAAATVAVKAINTAASGGNDVSSDIAYTQAKDLFIVRFGSFEFNWFMFIAVIALVVAYITLYKTKFGLRLMACGEHPQAADSVGINVYKMRWAGVLISGALGGLGGIVGVGVSADLLAEALGDGRAAYQDFHLIPDALAFRKGHHAPHLAHAGGQQGGTGDDLAAVLLCRADKGLGGHIHAQVDDLKAAALHHNFHQILADVVQVAPDSAQTDPAGRGLRLSHKEGL